MRRSHNSRVRWSLVAAGSPGADLGLLGGGRLGSVLGARRRAQSANPRGNGPDATDLRWLPADDVEPAGRAGCSRPTRVALGFRGAGARPGAGSTRDVAVEI